MQAAPATLEAKKVDDPLLANIRYVAGTDPKPEVNSKYLRLYGHPL